MLLILLALVAVGIIWVVINNIISEGSEEIGFGQFTIDLKIKQVKVEQDGIHVTVKRNAGKGDLSGMTFIINDGTETHNFEEETSMNELEEKTFSLNYSGIIKEIAIYPTLQAGEQIGQEQDQITYTPIQAVKNMPGLVSWWRFEDNANDEMNNNHGTAINTSLVAGRFGKAYEFAWINKTVQVNGSESLNITNGLAISAWIKFTTNFDAGHFLGNIVKKDAAYIFRFSSNYKLGGVINNGSWPYPGIESNKNNCDTDEWYYITFTYDKNNMKLYVNGVLDSLEPLTGDIQTSTKILSVGNGIASGKWEEAFPGVIDEVIIFNRSLSDEEIEDLYKLALS